MALKLDELRSTKFPRGFYRIAGEDDDADVDLAELDGYVAGLVETYLQNESLRADNIRLSRRLEAAFDRTLDSKEHDAVLEPYRREWKLLVELSELLAKTGRIRLEWTD